MAKHNGHKNYNAWSVSLNINNIEPLYRRARHLARGFGIGEGSRILAEELKGKTTAEGVPYTLTNIRLAMRGILD